MSAEKSEISPSNDDIPPISSAPDLTTERIVNVALGGAVFAAEGLSALIGRVRDEAPAFLDLLEEKGRPLREQILGTFAGSASDRSEPSDVSGAEAASGAVPVSAEDDISALEERVRELEQQMAIEDGANTLTPAEPPALAETTAEEATFVRGDEPVYESLAGSPYAISETNEEVALENNGDGDEPQH